MTNKDKLLKTLTYLGLGFVKSLPWFVNINLLLKIVKCCNIFLLQYRNYPKGGQKWLKIIILQV